MDRDVLSLMTLVLAMVLRSSVVYTTGCWQRTLRSCFLWCTARHCPRYECTCTKEPPALVLMVGLKVHSHVHFGYFLPYCN